MLPHLFQPVHGCPWVAYGEDLDDDVASLGRRVHCKVHCRQAVLGHDPARRQDRNALLRHGCPPCTSAGAAADEHLALHVHPAVAQREAPRGSERVWRLEAVLICILTGMGFTPQCQTSSGCLGGGLYMHPDQHGVLALLPDVWQPLVTQVPGCHVPQEEHTHCLHWLRNCLSCSSLPRRQQGILLHTLSSSEGYTPTGLQSATRLLA